MALRHSSGNGMDSFCSKSYSTNIDRQRLFTSCVSVSKISCSSYSYFLTISLGNQNQKVEP